MSTITKTKKEILASLGKVKVLQGGIVDLLPLSRIAAPANISIEVEDPTPSEPTTDEKITYAKTLDLSDIANVYLYKLTNGDVEDLADVPAFDSTAESHEDGWYQLPYDDFAQLTDPNITEYHDVEAVAGTVVVVFKYHTEAA